MDGRETDDDDTLERHTDTNKLKKERKKTDNPREGWEDGTPPPHRDFKERRAKERKKENRQPQGEESNLFLFLFSDAISSVPLMAPARPNNPGGCYRPSKLKAAYRSKTSS